MDRPLLGRGTDEMVIQIPETMKRSLLGRQGCRLVTIITTALLGPVTSRPNGHAGCKTS